MVTDRAPNVKSFPVEQRKPFKPKKPKRWSHQDDLDGAIGRTLRVQNKIGQLADAKLIAADQFTLKLEFDDGTLTIFKHALNGYQVI